MSPSVSRNRLAARSTSAAGGSSDDEPPRQLRRDEPRRRRVRREDVEHLFAVRLSAAGLDLVAEHHLLAVVVHARLEPEPAALARIRNRPAR